MRVWFRFLATLMTKVFKTKTCDTEIAFPLHRHSSSQFLASNTNTNTNTIHLNQKQQILRQIWILYCTFLGQIILAFLCKIQLDPGLFVEFGPQRSIHGLKALHCVLKSVLHIFVREKWKILDIVQKKQKLINSLQKLVNLCVSSFSWYVCMPIAFFWHLHTYEITRISSNNNRIKSFNWY